MGPQLYPLLGFLSVCLGQRVNYCIQEEDCGQKLKVYAWCEFKVMVCLISDLMFCFVFSLGQTKKPVKIPGYHYVDRKLDVTIHNKDCTSVKQCEISIARHSLLGWHLVSFSLMCFDSWR